MSGVSDAGLAWLRARLDDEERRARLVARTVGEHHYPPIDAPAHDDASGRWTAHAWQWHQKKVRAEDGRPHWLDEGPKVTDSVRPEVADHIAYWDPARVLADVDAKRKLLDEAEFWWGESDAGPNPMSDSTIRLLAQPYADLPDFPEELRLP